MYCPFEYSIRNWSERSWNESRHDRSQDDRQRMSENQARILQILADNKRRIEALEQ